MKKLTLFLLLVAALFVSCGERDKEATFGKTESGREYLRINGQKYYKVKVGKHYMYCYTFSTYGDIGSDIFHLEDLCEYCTRKLNKGGEN